MNNESIEFQQALINFGMNVSLSMIVADGIVRRAHIEGHKSGSKNGWYFFKGDHGIYGDWKSGIQKVWQAACKVRKEKVVPSVVPSIEILQAEAQKRANEILNIVTPEDGTHPYLLKKGIKAFGLFRKNDVLIIPIHDEKKTICSLQFISANGDKRFLKNGKKKGCFFMIGNPESSVLCIAEGYATAASIHQATDYPIIVAFDAGNLLPVGLVLRRAYPERKLLFCADNDVEVDGNPGLTKAREAAEKTDGIVLTPSID